MPYPSKFVEFFGPCTWKALHSVAYNYAANPNHPTPEEHKAAMDFFGALQYLLPCEMCAKHYGDYVKKHPINADSRESLVDWVYRLHSDVNERSHKPNLSREEVDKIYAGWSANDMDGFVNTSVSKRLRGMADPHNGKPIVHGIEEMLGGSVSMDKIIGIVVFGMIVGGVAYYASKKEKSEESKAKPALPAPPSTAPPAAGK